jgi:hypothetical protein
MQLGTAPPPPQVSTDGGLDPFYKPSFFVPEIRRCTKPVILNAAYSGHNHKRNLANNNGGWGGGTNHGC